MCLSILACNTELRCEISKVNRINLCQLLKNKQCDYVAGFLTDDLATKTLETRLGLLHFLDDTRFYLLGNSINHTAYAFFRRGSNTCAKSSAQTNRKDKKEIFGRPQRRVDFTNTDLRSNLVGI